MPLFQLQRKEHVFSFSRAAELRVLNAPVASANLKPNYSKCVLKVAKAPEGDLVARTES